MILTGNSESSDIARACTNSNVQLQQPPGYWDYPNREWKGRIATVEGCFAALGLLESYVRCSDHQYLHAAQRWFEFVETEVGFRKQTLNKMTAVNYFAHGSDKAGGVPNNSTLLLWLLGRLADVSGERRYLDRSSELVAWLTHVQLPSGELPYGLGRTADQDKIHFLCFQYNAFEFLDLVHYYAFTGDKRIWPVIVKLAEFLSNGLTESGASRYDCPP